MTTGKTGLPILGESNRPGGAGTVSNGTASATIIAQTKTDLILRVTKVNIAIEVAATGGGGILTISDTSDTVLHKTDADAIKDLILDYGEIGYPLAAGKGLKAAVSGAATTQATVNISAVGYLEYA